jgi:maltooligosyltrehalose trehalohydrolase
VRYDEQARWVRVRRGDFTLIMNFADAEQTVPAGARTLVLATHDTTGLRPDGAVTLPPLSGALVEGAPVSALRRPSAGAAL